MANLQPDTPIIFRATWTIRPGKLEQAKAAARDFVSAMDRALPKTRSAAVYLAPDQTRLIVQEIHSGPQAVREHLAGSPVKEFMPRFMESMDGPAFEVFGDLPEDIARSIEPFGPKVSKPVAVFYR